MEKNICTSFNPIINKEIRNFLDQILEIKNGDLKFDSSPLHILFPEIFISNAAKFKKVISDNGISGKVYFACKSNKANIFLSTAVHNAIGVEVSSIYELNNVLKNGHFGEGIIVSGPLKNFDFLYLALECGSIISIDDILEINFIKNIYYKKGIKIKPKLVIRINFSDKSISKFGIPVNKLKQVFEMLKNNNFDLLGFSFHVNNYSVSERVKSIVCAIDQIKIARLYGFTADILDIGGGYTVNYINKNDWDYFLGLKESQTFKKIFFNNKKITDFYPYFSELSGEKFLDAILKSPFGGTSVCNVMNNLGIKLVIEAGRSLLDQCGITLMKIKGIKKIKNENLIFVDGNINNLSEQWFNSDFLVDPILIKKNTKNVKKKKVVGLICGNLCLEQDMLSWRRVKLDDPTRDDLLVFINTAGYQMDSNESEFHGIPLPNKILAIKNTNGWKVYDDKKFNYPFVQNI